MGLILLGMLMVLVDGMVLNYTPINHQLHLATMLIVWAIFVAAYYIVCEIKKLR